jgi:hypothetical protein
MQPSILRSAGSCYCRSNSHVYKTSSPGKQKLRFLSLTFFLSSPFQVQSLKNIRLTNNSAPHNGQNTPKRNERLQRESSWKWSTWILDHLQSLDATIHMFSQRIIHPSAYLRSSNCYTQYITLHTNISKLTFSKHTGFKMNIIFRIIKMILILKSVPKMETRLH